MPANYAHLIVDGSPMEYRVGEMNPTGILSFVHARSGQTSFSKSVVANAYYYLNLQDLSGNVSAVTYRNRYSSRCHEHYELRPLDIIDQAMVDVDWSGVGTTAREMLRSVELYLRNGQLNKNRRSYALELQADEPICCTGDHLRSDGCNCTVAECGCAFDPDGDINTCVRCGKCSVCCDRADDCRRCGDCDDTVACSRFCQTCERCLANCCDCYVCASCDRRVRPDDWEGCGNCDSCAHCCECVCCDECSASVSETCGNCDRCENCCEHGEDCRWHNQFLLRNKSTLQFHSSGRTEFKKNPLKRYISCEIECDKAEESREIAQQLQKAVNKWGDSVVDDGSLSGSVAHEINTMPTNGDRFLKHISDLTEGYKAVGGRCSSACGLHVHIDARDIKPYDLRRILNLYAKIEKPLFELCSLERLNARYSSICGHQYVNGHRHPKIFKRQLLGGLYNSGRILGAKGEQELVGEGRRTTRTYNSRTGKPKKVLLAKGEKYVDVRYRALNVHSFFHRGTIEFRHHEGTVNYEQITNWALICAYVVEAGLKMTEAQIADLPVTPRLALLAILPESLHQFCKDKWENYPAVEAGKVWAKITKNAENYALPTYVEPVPAPRAPVVGLDYLWTTVSANTMVSPSQF